MFDNVDLAKMGELFKNVQAKAQEFEDELSKKEFKAQSGGGLVKVAANGKGEIIDISIDESLLDDRESLQILLIAAVNDALKLVNESRQSMAGDILGGFSL